MLIVLHLSHSNPNWTSLRDRSPLIWLSYLGFALLAAQQLYGNCQFHMCCDSSCLAASFLLFVAVLQFQFEMDAENICEADLRTWDDGCRRRNAICSL